MISTIAFDADDTLWSNNKHFNTTEQTFINLLKEYSTFKDLSSHLLKVEKKNIEFHGFGVKSFTLSMIETSIEVTQGRIPVKIISQILDLGRELQRYPLVLYPGVKDLIEKLSSEYKLVMITMGDLFDQERKIAQSDLGNLFDHIEIVSRKTPQVYQDIFAKYEIESSHCVMVGNSVRSDILPAMQAGSWGVLVSKEPNWEYENEAPKPTDSRKFFEISELPQLQRVLSRINFC